jgi:imidazolonepropionase-like amidohydrolase
MTRDLLLIRHARVIDGTGAGPLEDFAILVDEGRIAWTGPDTTAPSSHDAVVIEAGGRTVVPGLINAHVHLCHDGAPDFFRQAATDSVPTATIRSILNLERTLHAGITTVRDCGSANSIALDVARAVDSGLITGPRVLAAGRVITMTGGHGYFIGTEADGCDEVRKAVRTELKLGAHLIKVMATGGVLTPGVEPGQTTFQLDELSAAVQEAHNAGRLVACHAIGAEGIRYALEAGVDTIEHGNYMDDRGIELAVERRAFLIPTLVAPRSALAQSSDHEQDYVVRKAEALIRVHQETFTAAYRAGVRIAAGTDAGTPFNPHGDIVRELRLMVDYCMTPMEAILAATLRAAQALGLDSEVGSIEVGKAADLIVVGGDPLADIDNIRDVQLVMKSGYVCLDNRSGAPTSAVAR